MSKYTLEVEVTQGNAKRVDPETLKHEDSKGGAWVLMKLGGQEQKTEELPGLDPVWEKTYTFEVTDPETDKLEVQFYLGKMQIGLDGCFVLDGLKKKVSTYKALAFPGGKIDFQLRAIDFGKEQEEEEDDDDWMSFV
eukprot:CAMPEP_0201516422 /NCGR_PEP_ID=MMETSP0161_2-20130828/7751_1 /ASSEMBLY_ACC=CAM_ASM_000251 /TAXON_ID=180227 /ORGANISM="Neoparamoeba aestuarina, Strain SoJaBio B1-5/56/2" /LENGTH=136 /DNA_ID=CAMNT_0047913555 /DNA_START=67 /DNA_END=477 /DNA_ORIENTATION=+